MSQLKAAVAECIALLEVAKTAHVRDALTQAKVGAERQIEYLELKARMAAERKAGPETKR